MIFLQPHSGLANRIRAIVSGLSLSKELNQTLTIIWNKDEGCNIEFHEIFKPVQGLKIKQKSWKNIIMKISRGKKYLSFLPRLIGIDFYMFDENFKDYVWCNKGHIFNPTIIKKNAKDIYINTCNDFYYKKSLCRK